MQHGSTASWQAPARGEEAYDEATGGAGAEGEDEDLYLVPMAAPVFGGGEEEEEKYCLRGQNRIAPPGLAFSGEEGPEAEGTEKMRSAAAPGRHSRRGSVEGLTMPKPSPRAQPSAAGKSEGQLKKFSDLNISGEPRSVADPSPSVGAAAKKPLKSALKGGGGGPGSLTPSPGHSGSSSDNRGPVGRGGPSPQLSRASSLAASRNAPAVTAVTHVRSRSAVSAVSVGEACHSRSASEETLQVGGGGSIMGSGRCTGRGLGFGSSLTLSFSSPSNPLTGCCCLMIISRPFFFFFFFFFQFSIFNFLNLDFPPGRATPPQSIPIPRHLSAAKWRSL